MTPSANIIPVSPVNGTTTATTDGHNPVKAPAKALKPHPLDPLSPEEISAVSLALRHHIASNTPVKAVKFTNAYVLQPPKRDVLAYLGIPLETGKEPEPAPESIPRRAEADFIDAVTGDVYVAQLTFVEGEFKVDDLTKLPEGTQSIITPEELCLCEYALRKDERVCKLAAEVGVTPDQLHADGWALGWDDRWPTKTRVQQCLLYARYGEHENIYCHPMDFFPVIDSNSFEVLAVDFAPHRLGGIQPSTRVPPLHAKLERERIPPPQTKHEYLPDLLEKNPNFKGMRDDVKPLYVVQPEGVSFTVRGRELEWQKWKMHVGFEPREGLVLNTITYNDDGMIRPIAYKVSCCEMVIPYGDPQFPHPRKFAFDVGEYGMGTVANELSLGCDCLGTICYLPGCFVGNNGEPIKIKHAVCIHEEDAGLLWKHTDCRAGGRAHSVRARKLVVSWVATVSNYEYIFYWNFFQDGMFELEIRLSGILNVYVLGEGEKQSRYTTQVAPRIDAQYHQHLFCMRMDPMIDGIKNSVMETDVVPSEFPTGSEQNFAGNGFYTKNTIIKHTGEGERQYSAENDRRWTIVNTSKPHYSSGQPAGYRIVTHSFPRLLAAPGSWVRKRAPFARSSLWVTRYAPGREWPAGKYVPQTRAAPEDSLEYWMKGDENLDQEDIIVWFTIGTNHIPRPEDWPVMPADHLKVVFRPQSFFQCNPALDVPSTSAVGSCYAFGTAAAPVPGTHAVAVTTEGEAVVEETAGHLNGGANGHGTNGNGTNGHRSNNNGTNGAACCH
ncbi:hypothetical protein DACRYDRAFT_76109 [Dacryopinax primogenitus]|uniref:Amine oxidase n=1 Tax=Dacryopinax primogenitus (strain DJM 731) TaxID=1858805 RepID=M5G458_DACPD|nr:uncharacterized protein DACRYDRAFT_76109 [Dacryopinax primogenitus]EJU05051.1 hypothetical protein DACRYDRAFT_76109 [Dacryopinax primogenitus]